MHADHEELARAELYGLLANLYQAPPPPALLKRIALQRALAEGGTGPTAESPKSAPSQLETRWTALVERAGTLPAAAIADEHEALFGGVGKPEIFLHASWFLAGFLNEKPLATLRGPAVEALVCGWLDTIATNVLRAHARSVARRPQSVDLDDPSTTALIDPSSPVDQRLLDRALDGGGVGVTLKKR